MPDASAPSSQGFCTGANKIAYGDATVTPPAITSALLFMNCCKAATFRFHTMAQLGFDIVAMLRMAPSGFQPGHYTVSESSEPSGLSLAVDDGEAPEWAPAVGSIDVIEGGDYSSPTRMRFCVEVSPTGHPLAGTHVFVASAGIMASDEGQRFGLWLLKKPTITALAAAELPLGSLELADQPVLDLLGIGFYEADLHAIGWAEPWYNADSFKARLPTVGVQGLPFVAVADGERIYLGAFVTLLSSFTIPMPSIYVEDIDADGLTIAGGSPGGASTRSDARNDPRLLTLFGDTFKLVQ